MYEIFEGDKISNKIKENQLQGIVFLNFAIVGNIIY